MDHRREADYYSLAVTQRQLASYDRGIGKKYRGRDKQINRDEIMWIVLAVVIAVVGVVVLLGATRLFGRKK